MHELGLAEGIVQIARQQIEVHGASHVNAIKLLIGDAVAVDPEALRFGFEVVVETIPELRGAVLEIETAPYRGQCRSCSARFDIVDFSAWCPVCGAPSVDIISGNEFHVLDMDIDLD